MNTVSPRSSKVYDAEDKKSEVGANTLWNGPFNTSGLPKKQGSSSGKNGIIFNNDKPTCNYEPITQRAKSKF